MLYVLDLSAQGARPGLRATLHSIQSVSSRGPQRPHARAHLSGLTAIGSLPRPFKASGPQESHEDRQWLLHYSATKSERSAGPQHDHVAEWPPGATPLAVTHLRERPRASRSARPLRASLSTTPGLILQQPAQAPPPPARSSFRSAHAGAAESGPARVSSQLLLWSSRHS
ncbi:hypothetical protein NDU88_002525 [Pleurodeles waltl]|uniref:Uncharacterized protein n=1 Tax=Pleurodeles waltl TaxID=8319 RepID=A0AAV7UDE5_PLEWA|nr:hypothetical protein NDU88_002525 [Pleurodeles waltl]